MSIYQSMPLEEFDGSVGNRFTRDYENMATVDIAGIGDSRKGRQLDNQTIERQGRLYVDPETLVSATGKDAQLTVDDYGLTKVGVESDAYPAGAVKSDEEAQTAGIVPAKGAFVDSDNDGVSNAEDYAPHDPEVTEPPEEPTP